MVITFLGATHEVTGSCSLLEVGPYKGLVDYGMEQGKDFFENKEIPVLPSELDFVFVTHAHIDHTGLLPVLAKRGFKGKVYCSEATANLMHIMLLDSANIQMSNAEYESRKALRNGECEVEPLYDINDVENLIKCLRPCSYGEIIQVNENINIRFTDVGHLLGSAAIEVFMTENGISKTFCFSGDIGNTNQPILTDPNVLEGECDYLVLESTYGDRLHEKTNTDYVTSLANIIQKTLDNGGNLIIPSFAVGRTQEILYFIREIKAKNLVKGHEHFPVYIDSPLAVEATTIFMQCDTDYLDDDFKALLQKGINPLVFDGLQLVQSQEESKEINADKTPKVIISASGMCEAGRVRHHLKHNLWRNECKVLFVGYQAGGSLGRLLVDGAKKVKLFGEDIAVNAEILVLPGISGHADKEGLIRWLQSFSKKPEVVFINHGDPDAVESFSKCLKYEYGYHTEAPYSGTKFDIARGKFDFITTGIPINQETKKEIKSGANVEIYNSLVNAAEKLLGVCKASKGVSNKILSSATSDIYALIRKLK